jgi:two-component system, chemotaxis family, protein-glutamate methylesterase/glutaminase
MAIRVLVVDDSAFFRRAIKSMLEADPTIQVVGMAGNGQEAVEQTLTLKPDLVTMDIEMPVMDGITALRRIMARSPRPVLMFSSLTQEGARATLDALDAGAADFLPKQFEEIARDRAEVGRVLCQRIKTLARRAPHAPAAPRAPAPPVRSAPPAAARPGVAVRDCSLVLIGTSTGGPVALQRVLTALPGTFRRPLVLIQHMPGAFTPTFAERLNGLCAIEVREAKDQDVLRPGLALLAPGGKQLQIEGNAGALRVRISESPPELNYKPSVDVTFTSAERVNAGKNLGVILTGMGADGREGARLMKRNGSVVWSQDQASCTVYGMPAAVAEAGLSDRVLTLADVGPELARSF